jgi:serine/threonine-protein kinase
MLIDFGIAILREGRESVTASVHVAGALDYMAPEQLGGTVSAATDLYSLAAIVFEMLTGSRWREAESSQKAEMLLGSVELSGSTHQLIEFFRLNLAFRSEDRPQTAGELLQQFRAALTGFTSQSGCEAMR